MRVESCSPTSIILVAIHEVEWAHECNNRRNSRLQLRSTWGWLMIGIINICFQQSLMLQTPSHQRLYTLNRWKTLLRACIYMRIHLKFKMKVYWICLTRRLPGEYLTCGALPLLPKKHSCQINHWSVSFSVSSLSDIGSNADKTLFLHRPRRPLDTPEVSAPDTCKQLPISQFRVDV